MKQNVTNTLLIHPHPLECEAVAEWLEKRSAITLSGKIGCVEKVTQLPYFLEIDLIVVFAYKSEGIAGQIMSLRKMHPNLKFQLLAPISTLDLAREVIRSGVSGYIGINAEPDELEYAIKMVSEGKVWYSQEVMMQLSDEGSAVKAECPPVPTTKDFLSKRETEILKLVASEYSTNRIASELFISGKTVETHRRNLFQKLGVKNSVGLTKIAVRLGVV